MNRGAAFAVLAWKPMATSPARSSVDVTTTWPKRRVVLVSFSGVQTICAFAAVWGFSVTAVLPSSKATVTRRRA